MTKNIYARYRVNDDQEVIYNIGKIVNMRISDIEKIEPKYIDIHVNSERALRYDEVKITGKNTTRLPALNKLPEDLRNDKTIAIVISGIISLEEYDRSALSILKAAYRLRMQKDVNSTCRNKR